MECAQQITSSSAAIHITVSVTLKRLFCRTFAAILNNNYEAFTDGGFKNPVPQHKRGG